MYTFTKNGFIMGVKKKPTIIKKRKTSEGDDGVVVDVGDDDDAYGDG